MKIEQIHDMWVVDSKFDDLNLDTESLSIESLHAKYNRILSDCRMQLRALVINRRTHVNTLREYYLGNLNNPDDLKRINREPFAQRVLKNEVHNHVDSDDDLIKIDSKIAIAEEQVEVVTEIIKMIHKRSFNIRASIDWKKFTSGF